MLTYDELVKEIKRRTLPEKLSLMEVLAHVVKEEVAVPRGRVAKSKSTAPQAVKEEVPIPSLDFDPTTLRGFGLLRTDQPASTDETANPGSVKPRIPVEELRGLLKFDGPAPSDEELDEIRYNYLAEKYGL